MKESEESPAYEAHEHSKSFLKRALSDKKGGTASMKHEDGKKEHKGKRHHKGMKK